MFDARTLLLSQAVRPAKVLNTEDWIEQAVPVPVRATSTCPVAAGVAACPVAAGAAEQAEAAAHRTAKIEDNRGKPPRPRAPATDTSPDLSHGRSLV